MGRNFINLVKIMLTLIPAGISTEDVFSVLERVKIKLRKSLSDKKMFNLVIFSFYPDMVSSIDIILLYNKFV